MVKTIVKTRKKYRRKNKKQMGGDDTNIPTIKDNMERLINIFKKAFIIVNVYLLNKFENKFENISNSYGINPNETLEDQISKITKKTEDLNNLLNTPEGQQALSNLKNLFNKITKEVVIPSSIQLAEELIDGLQPIMIRGQNAVFALLSASPFGAIIDIPRFLSESLGVLEKSVTLVNNGLKIVNETFDKVEDNKAKVKEEVSRIYSLINNTNGKISSGLDMIENRVNNTLEIPTFNNFKVNPVIQNGGGVELLETYRNQAKMVGGRIIESQLEFLTPYSKQSVTKRKSAFKRKTTLRKR